jgi:hypothetical protein
MEMLLTLTTVHFSSRKNKAILDTVDKIIAYVISYSSQILFGKIPQPKALKRECE